MAAGNKRNKRTTHPRKQARRERSADRFNVKKDRLMDAAYMANKKQEAEALGLDFAQVPGYQQATPKQ